MNRWEELARFVFFDFQTKKMISKVFYYCSPTLSSRHSRSMSFKRFMPIHRKSRNSQSWLFDLIHKSEGKWQFFSTEKMDWVIKNNRFWLLLADIFVWKRPLRTNLTSIVIQAPWYTIWLLWVILTNDASKDPWSLRSMKGQIKLKLTYRDSRNSGSWRQVKLHCSM